MKKNASDLRTFIAVKHIEKEVETQNTCLQSIVNSDSLNQTKLTYKIHTDLKNITTSIKELGEVVAESMPCEMVLVRRKDKQAEMMVAELSSPMSVENIQLNLKQMISIKGRDTCFTYITGCSLLPDGRMVFSCYSRYTLTFINKEGIESFQIGKDQTGSSAFDTVYIKDSNSVAVSCGYGGKECITIIDIESMEVMATVPVAASSFGMAVRGRTIYCCSKNKLKIINLSDQSVSAIIKSNMSKVCYVATSGDKLYYTNFYTEHVKCCDLHGAIQWKFKDSRVLQEPYGISVDNDGNVYVAGQGTNNVVVISPDGQRHRQLLSANDGLIDPCVLDYDQSTNRLLVVNQSGTAFLFDVTRGQ